MLKRQFCDRLSKQVGQRTDDDQESPDLLGNHRVERAVQVIRGPNIGDLERHIELS